MTKEWILNLDCTNLLAYPPSAMLYDQLIRYPNEIVLSVMDYVTTMVFAELFRNQADDVDVDDVTFKVDV
jgi:DNA replication licensing factor MCM4